MIVDSSAIVAIVAREPEHDAFVARIAAAESVGVGAPTLLETSIVLGSRFGPAGSRSLDQFVQRSEIEVVPFDAAHATIAADAWQRYGRGRHAAALNFGDCLAYATARVARRPLLCKGADFALTDLELA